MPEPTGRKTFKYKLRPTPEQAVRLETTLQLCRELYNAALEERKEAWQKCRISVNYYQQKAQLPEIRALREDCAAVNAQVLQDVMLRVERTFKAFFRRIANGEKPGYPRFKAARRYHSFTFPQVGSHGGVRIDNGFLILLKIGRVAVHWSRPVKGTPKTVGILQEPDGWYACISCTDVPGQSLPLTGVATGIDLGLESFLTVADGTNHPNPRHYRKAEKRLVKAQRRVSRRKRGSRRRRKALGLLQRAHQKVARQRRDFHHKTALFLLKRYDTIYFKALQVANMVQNHHLAKSILDAGWGQFCTILVSKLETLENKL